MGENESSRPFCVHSRILYVYHLIGGKGNEGDFNFLEYNGANLCIRATLCKKI